MKIVHKLLLCLAAAAFAVAGCSTASNGGNSFMEFFGFGQPEQASVSPSSVEGKAQSTPAAETDPFGTGAQTASTPQTGGGLSDLDWDSIDPALVELDEPETESKSSADDSWKDDPYAWSFSSSNYQDSQSQTEQKGPYQPVRFTPTPYGYNPQRYPQGNQNNITFYRFYDNPVFRPMCELPRTGFPTGKRVEVRESVSYAATNMSLSIPTLNVNEEIVIVPLVDDNFPVESLGEKIGLLEGSGPGPEDLFVLAGHNHLNTQEQGPFVKLSALKETDLIFVRGAKDASRTFVVYANEKFAADDIEGLLSYAKPGCMILITCEDESIEGGYLNRRVIFAEAKEE